MRLVPMMQRIEVCKMLKTPCLMHAVKYSELMFGLVFVSSTGGWSMDSVGLPLATI